jgi:hypothetical protein
MAIKCTGRLREHRVHKMHKSVQYCNVYTLMYLQKIKALNYIGCTGCTGGTKCADMQNVHSGAFLKVHGCKVRRVHWVHKAHRRALVCEVCTLMHHQESMAPKYIGCPGCTGCTKCTNLFDVHYVVL